MSTARGPLHQPDYKRGLLIRRAGRLPKARLTVQVGRSLAFVRVDCVHALEVGPSPIYVEPVAHIPLPRRFVLPSLMRNPLPRHSVQLACV